MESTPARTAALIPCAHRVGHHVFARAMRHLHGTRHLRLAQFLHVVVADRVHHASGGHQLDPVGSVLDVVPHSIAHSVHGVGNIRTPRQRLVSREHISIAMASGNADKIPG
jgi:hypothetical protein